MTVNKTLRMIDRPRLIEVAFPLEQASIASVHEKNVRHGHISTLHIWPARRPLAASRAALLATLLPDPGNAEDRQRLLDLIGGKVVVKTVTEQDEDGNTVSEQKRTIDEGVLAWGQENAPAIERLRNQIVEFYGGRAPKVLDPFAGGGAIPLEAMRLGCVVTASDVNPVAFFVLNCTLNYPQRFAGQKWPLPSFVRNWSDFVEDFVSGKVRKRRGIDRPHFNDPKQYGFDEMANSIGSEARGEPRADEINFLPDADLGWHVRAWGRWVLECARQDLADRYPLIKGEPTLAYLWARTARDPRTTGRIPLLKTFWICKKRGKRAALLPVPNEDASGVTFKLLHEIDFEHPQRVINEHPYLQAWEITAENFTDFIKTGTMNRSGVWSPCSGRPGVITLRTEDLKRQGQQGLLGVQMTTVVVEVPVGKGSKTKKKYRLPTDDEIYAAKIEQEDLEGLYAEIPFGLPDELAPVGGGHGASRAFSVSKYGIRLWREMFTPRQLFAIGVFVKHTRAAILHAKEQKNPFAPGIAAYLTCTIGKLLDYENVGCSWYLNNEQITHLFNRFALPFKWDFAEASPIGGASGSWESMLNSVAKSVTTCVSLRQDLSEPQILRRSAIKPKQSQFDAIVTDPPYYDAIPYSDLMDFFYIWQRRILHDFDDEYTANFRESLSPKWNQEEDDGELIDDETRFGGDRLKSKASYENGMAKAFSACFQQLSDQGRLAIVFANKEVDAWETLIGALIKAGATVTASWPIQTEMPNRSRGINSAALATSVWIVCRKRSVTAQAGWDVNVLERMREILFNQRSELGDKNILQYYFDLGINGPDFLWAALGPALEAYSQHPFVKKTEGGLMRVEDFLGEVRKLVLQFALGELPGFHELQAQTQGRGESIELDAVTQYYLLHRASFGFQLTPAGPCIMYAQACGKSLTELKVVWNVVEQGGPSKKGRPRKDVEEGEEEEEEGSGNEFRLRNWDERAVDENLGASHNGQPAPLIDRLHRLMALFHRNQAANVQTQYEAWGLASERAFPPLIQATRELAMRDRNDTERRLIEAVATQLKFTRRQVVEQGVAKDEPFFPTMVSYGKKD
jgi:adenine-specific DNA methylase